jgi:hypothetical protein
VHVRALEWVSSGRQGWVSNLVQAASYQSCFFPFRSFLLGFAAAGLGCFYCCICCCGCRYDTVAAVAIAITTVAAASEGDVAGAASASAVFAVSDSTAAISS